MSFESTKQIGDTWSPMKNADGTPKFVASETDILDGYYVEKRENVGENNANVYSIQKKDGTRLNVWGTKALNGEMDKIRIGQFIRIQWLGKFLTDDGKKKFKTVESCTNTKMSFHSWECFIDKDQPMLSTLSHTTQKATANDNLNEGDLPF